MQKTSPLERKKTSHPKRKKKLVIPSAAEGSELLIKPDLSITHFWCSKMVHQAVSNKALTISIAGRSPSMIFSTISVIGSFKPCFFASSITVLTL